jgi:hypothetical protein
MMEEPGQDVARVQTSSLRYTKLQELFRKFLQGALQCPSQQVPIATRPGEHRQRARRQQAVLIALPLRLRDAEVPADVRGPPPGAGARAGAALQAGGRARRRTTTPSKQTKLTSACAADRPGAVCAVLHPPASRGRACAPQVLEEVGKFSNEELEAVCCEHQMLDKLRQLDQACVKSSSRCAYAAAPRPSVRRCSRPFPRELWELPPHRPTTLDLATPLLQARPAAPVLNPAAAAPPCPAPKPADPINLLASPAAHLQPAHQRGPAGCARAGAGSARGGDAGGEAAPGGHALKGE